MKKYFFILIVLGLVVFIGCGGGDEYYPQKKIQQNNLENTQDIEEYSEEYQTKIRAEIQNAVFDGKFELAKKLILSPGFNINSGDGRLIRYIAGKKRWEMDGGFRNFVKFGVVHGMDLDVRDPEYGYTALHNAVMNLDIETIKILLELGANPNIKNDDGLTALDLAHHRYDNKEIKYKKLKEDIIKLLKKYTK